MAAWQGEIGRMKFFEVTLYNRYGEVYWTLEITANSAEEAFHFAKNHEQFEDGDEILHVADVIKSESNMAFEKKILLFKQDEKS